MLERSGLVATIAASVDWAQAPGSVRIAALVLASATLSALMSNTGTAAMLIPIARGIDPALSTPVLIAIGASLGMPFVISTPPNAMVYGEGGVDARDLLAVGLPIMLLGSLLVAMTGPGVLRLLGL
jgi:sodium-dependent dicarboxylate transporter 2/3/5